MSILINNKEFLTRPCTFLIRFPPPFPPPLQMQPTCQERKMN